MQSSLTKILEYDSNLSAKEVLENAMSDLGLESQDILHIAAKYINNNIKRRNNEDNQNTQLLDLAKYSAKNYNENEWNEYMRKLKKQGLEKKLEFQVALSAITSEPFLRDYYYKKECGEDNKKLAEKMINPQIFNYGELAVSFASELSNYIRTPITNGFICNSIHEGEYINNLRNQAENPNKSQEIIEELLEKFSDNYFL